MGQDGKILCHECGAKFWGLIGGGDVSDVLRCLRCDDTQLVDAKFSREDFKFPCKDCGGPMRSGMTPRCPKCGSRETAMFLPQVFWE